MVSASGDGRGTRRPGTSRDQSGYSVSPSPTPPLLRRRHWHVDRRDPHSATVCRTMTSILPVMRTVPHMVPVVL
jgi:hypothetical protein